ncbi:MAG TPA: tetratricopeptide repeat protein, partial [Ardenticatenaceae bacterium]
GEYEFPLAPLDLPNLRQLPALEPLSRTAAVELFVRRAQAVKPDFVLTAENAPIIAEICVRLDGLPLAIEMAAARVRFLPPKNILSRLQHRLELLTSSARDLPARQQTMRDTVAWSYDLLDEAEKRLFRRIAVFRSGASLESIEAICNTAGDLQLDVLDGISALMDSSLLQHAPAGGSDGETRFLMLQTIREYALEKLEESGESTLLHQSYALFFLKLVEEAEPKVASGERVRWLKRLEAEYDNLRGALEWSLTETDAPELALHLSRLLFWYWYFRGRFEEGRNWLTRALDHDKQAAPTMARAVALYCAGTLAWFTGEAQEAHDYLQASVAISRHLGEKWVLAMCLGILGVDAVRRYGYDRAQALHAESIGLLTEIGAKWSLGWAYFWQGLSAGRANDPAGRAALEQSVAIWREVRDPWALAVAEMGLAEAAYHTGDYEAARASLDDVLPTFREMGDKWLMAHSLMMLGGVALSHGNHEHAEALYAESLALRRDLGDKYGIAHALRGLASIAQQKGDAEQAISHYKASLALYREVSSLEGIAACVKGLAVVATAQGQHTHAAELLGAAENVKAPAGVLIPPTERPTYDRALGTLREQMSADAFAAAWAAGQAMSLEHAVTRALEAQEQTHP